ncbi:MAG TPA: IniB N-terminal domain-containing protein [Pseudonocardiaceae bacterium]|nr:IniB N-terminal domain-containing protein [Pseudonocardiaceae bacterium]
MTTTQSLLDFILNLLRDSDAKAAFVANPDQALANAGLSDVCSQDVSDAMSYVSEYHPVAYAGDPHNTDYRPDYRPDSDYRSGNDYRPDHQPDSHAAAVQQLQYVSNNYTYDDSHDTTIDKSIHENIWNKGTLSQSFDDHSVTATDHSVATGGDINGDVANGNHNVVGDGNSVGNTSHHDDHSVNDSFNGNNSADHGGVAGTGNDGNSTNPFNSNVATNGATMDNSTHDLHNTNVSDSYNDSHNHDLHNTTDIDSNNHEPHNTTIADSNNHPTYVDDSYNHDQANHDSYNQDSAITHVDQHGLIDANLSPAVTAPVEHNDVLSPEHHG